MFKRAHSDQCVPGRSGRGAFIAAAVVATLAEVPAGSVQAAIPTLMASPSSITFNYTLGMSPPPSQALTLRGSGSAKVAVAVTKSPDVGWLIVTPRNGTTLMTVIVRPNPTGLPLGIHETDIVLTSAGVSNSPLTVHVTLKVKNPPPKMTFGATKIIMNAATDDVAPATQTLAITTNGDPLTYSVKVSGAAWLTVSPMSGVAMLGSPATLTLTADATGLLPATYTGKLSISSTNRAVKPTNVTVSLIVGPGTAILTEVWPPTIAVNSPDTVITLTGQHLFRASVVRVGATDLSPAWISTEVLMVTVPENLLTTTGTLAITVTNAPRPASNSVNFAVSPPGPLVWTVLNGASFAKNTTPPVMAPGEIISIQGSGLGPDPDSALVATPPTPGGAYPASLGTAPNIVTVEFDVDGAGTWVAAPLTYADSGQINAVVPFDITAPADIDMRVTYGADNVVTPVHIAATAPGIFTTDGSGTGQAAALNCTLAGVCKLNSASNAAARGSSVRVYATGGGQTNPLPTTEGELVASPAPPLVAVDGTVTLGTEVITPTFIGAAEGSMAGMVQIDFVVPATATVGKTIPLSFSAGGVASQTGVTIAVK